MKHSLKENAKRICAALTAMACAFALAACSSSSSSFSMTSKMDNTIEVKSENADPDTSSDGNIVIQNCVFEQPNSFFRLRFGQQWCVNRSLADITFRNCKCVGVSLPIDLYCDENEPCTLRLEDVEISAREGFEDTPFMHADNFKQIYFENVTLTGFTDPTILSKTEGEVIMKNSTDIKFKLTDALQDKYV